MVLSDFLDVADVLVVLACVAPLVLFLGLLIAVVNGWTSGK